MLRLLYGGDKGVFCSRITDLGDDGKWVKTVCAMSSQIGQFTTWLTFEFYCLAIQIYKYQGLPYDMDHIHREETLEDSV